MTAEKAQFHGSGC